MCNDACFSMTTHEMHLIMGAVSLWTRPPALYLCTGPKKKSTPQLIKPRRQDLVDELQLRINHSVPDTPTGMQHEEHDMHNDAHVNNLVQELDAEATSGSESTFRENPKP